MVHRQDSSPILAIPPPPPRGQHHGAKAHILQTGRRAESWQCQLTAGPRNCPRLEGAARLKVTPSLQGRTSYHCLSEGQNCMAMPVPDLLRQMAKDSGVTAQPVKVSPCPALGPFTHRAFLITPQITSITVLSVFKSVFQGTEPKIELVIPKWGNYWRLLSPFCLPAFSDYNKHKLPLQKEPYMHTYTYVYIKFLWVPKLRGKKACRCDLQHTKWTKDKTNPNKFNILVKSFW